MQRVLLLAMALLAIFAAPSEAQEIVVQPPTSLSPGDSVFITVWRQPELSGDFVVGTDGAIVHPLYRNVVVGGMPLIEAEQRIRTLLLELESDPAFVIRPLLRVAVGGEVKEPDVYYMDPGVTISQAVDRAGGVTDVGREDRVRLIRDGVEMRFDLHDIETRAIEMTVRSGDRVMVDRRVNVVRDYLGPVTSAVQSLATLYAFLNLVGIIGE